ncbi:MAG: HU family DNA-binding protein [Prevotella sp.]|jgi:DNA-binding protein HU-beta/integration host factor subunit alpha|nr:HU family DNA-binding protein [Prevotella sp.]
MNNKMFVAELAKRMGYKNNNTQRLINIMLGEAGDRFIDGDSLQISNFGTFEVRKKLERVIVNPTTGQQMLVPPKMALTFRPNTTWKDKVKKGGRE